MSRGSREFTTVADGPNAVMEDLTVARDEVHRLTDELGRGLAFADSCLLIGGRDLEPDVLAFRKAAARLHRNALRCIAWNLTADDGLPSSPTGPETGERDGMVPADDV